MSFTPESQTPEGLEDRLRGLILNNSQSIVSPQYPSQSDPQSPQLSPQRTQPNVATGPGLSTRMDHQQASPGGRKRPNQAQRRQLSSQLSIPVDSRSTTQGYHSGRGVSSSSGFSPSGGWNSSTGFAPPRHYGPQSAPLSQGRPQQYQYSPRYQNRFPASPYPSEAPFQQPSHLSPMHQINGPSQQQGYRYNRAPQSAGLMESSQWQESDHYGRPQTGGRYGSRPPPQSPQLYQTGPHNGQRFNPLHSVNPDQLAKQSAYLQRLLDESITLVGIGKSEAEEKEEFRVVIEKLCRDAIVNFEREENDPNFDSASIQLKCFGSMASGFATKASDMDLALLSPKSNPAPDSSESSIPRLLEKCLLEAGYGARLLTKTRVPIIKLCQRPTVRLMSDLLEERAKWESGFIAEESGVDDTGVTQEMTTEEENNDNTSVPQSASEMQKSSRRSPDEVYEGQLLSLYQRVNQSLGDYYGSAKRLLRRLGGKDIIAGNSPLTVREYKIVQDVCKAFVNGLSDATLKSRLFAYQSLAFEISDNSRFARSLSGVYSQIEGENLAMRWDGRPLIETSIKHETHCAEEITKWQNLMDQVHIETSQYSRMLHNAMERLRKTPSLQILFLEQGQHEDPSQYYSRTRKLLMDLGVNSAPHDDNHQLSILVSQYVAGVRDPKAREILELISSENPLASINSIALFHRTIQLANDYDTALAKNLYNDKDRMDIEQYVTILRDGVANCKIRSRDLPPERARMFPLIPISTTLAMKLQSLPDPSQIHKARDRYSDHLEFRNQDNIGIQCDINFSAQLAIQNTLLLRCYSRSDSRVKPLILFVKRWAKLRGINTPYRGTLSSYGYVLMVLHYLINIANPFVCPNLQLLRRPLPGFLNPTEVAAQTTCSGCDVQFWRDENEIADLAERDMLNHNKDSIGILLRGFYEYYACNGQLSTGNSIGFDWMRDVLSLRTEGGLLTKQEKGWVGARTVIEITTEAAPASSSVPVSSSSATYTPAGPFAEANATSIVQTINMPVPPKKLIVKDQTKEIRHRYLFAIEDPFELDHNVARTVTHNGIVSIRDEFRRAWRIIKGVGHQGPRTTQVSQENLLEEVSVDQEARKTGLEELMKEIHGPSGIGDGE